MARIPGRLLEGRDQAIVRKPMSLDERQYSGNSVLQQTRNSLRPGKLGLCVKRESWDQMKPFLNSGDGKLEALSKK